MHPQVRGILPRRESSMNWRGWFVLCGVVAWTVILVRLTRPNLADVPNGAGPDERSYLHYARQIAERGLSGYPELFREYVGHIAHAQYYPTPLRFTTIVLDAVFVWFLGPTFSSLQQVSLVAFLVLLLCVFFCFRQAIGNRAALLTVLLVSASPLGLGMARRALADSLVATLMVASLWLCLRALLRE